MQEEIFRDIDGNEHKFIFEPYACPTGKAMKAYEVKNCQRKGYEFTVIENFNANSEYLRGNLTSKIKQAILEKHIEYDEKAHTWSPINAILKGRIASRRCESDFDLEPVIVIDGNELSWEEFGRTMLVQEGFDFKIEFINYDKV